MGKVYKKYLRKSFDFKNIPDRSRLRHNLTKKEFWKSVCCKSIIEKIDSPNILNSLPETEDEILVDNVTDGYSSPTQGANNCREECTEKTKLEVSLLLFGFSLKHNLSKVLLSDLLQLLKVINPTSQIPCSVYELYQIIPLNTRLVKKHFYCTICEVYINPEFKSCNLCKSDIETTAGHFYMTDIEALISMVLLDKENQLSILKTFEKRREKKAFMREVTDGIMYQRKKIGEHDLTVTANTDGVPVFKSSKFSVWPLLLSINELNFSARRKNTILAGLWFGDKKPNFDCFLDPLTHQIKKINENGISWSLNENNFRSKLFVILFVADSVARCVVQGIQQFNGSFGCSWCEQKGESYCSYTGQRKWIYLPSKYNNSNLRNHNTFLKRLQEFSEILRTSTTEVAHHFGIKTASKLLLLKNFDIVHGFTFEYMHTILLGITRTFTTTWLDTKSHNLPFYIGSKTALIDKLFLKVLVPFEYPRCTRSIVQRRFWKASEWKTWLYAIPVVLQNILNWPYLKHFEKLIYAIHIMCRENIYPPDLILAKDLLSDFVNNVETLYGHSFCSYNVHLLLHLCDCVQNWGPLWAYSAFQFENFNGLLLNSFRGTTGVPQQMSNRIAQIAQAAQIGKMYLNENEVKNLYFALLDNRKYVKNIRKCGSITFLGSEKLYILSTFERHVLMKHNINARTALSYSTCIINNKMYSSKRRMTQNRCNCIVSTSRQTLIVRDFLYASDPLSNLEGMFAICNRINLRSCVSTPFILKVTKINNVPLLINLEEIVKAKFYVIVNDAKEITYLIQLPNTKEVE